jgi:hypothetical protein
MKRFHHNGMNLIIWNILLKSKFKYIVENFSYRMYNIVSFLCWYVYAKAYFKW